MKSQNNQLAGGEIVLYQSQDGNTRIDVRLQDETVWLTQAQIAELFNKDRSVISKHIKRVLKQEELEPSVCANFAHTATDGKVYNTQYYNLDMIISIGYRVNSKCGIQFRRWSSNILKEYLINGYSINREKIASNKLLELKQTVDLLSNVLIKNSLVTELGQDVLHIIKSYSKTWHLLLAYDENRLFLPDKVQDSSHVLHYSEAFEAIGSLKNDLINRHEATELFGQERENALASILKNIEQTFFGEALYKTTEEKAAHLLYFIIKDHPFVDGNKRIACFMFLLYLKLQNMPLKLNDNGLVALALLVAESDPNQKDLMVRLIVNLLVNFL